MSIPCYPKLDRDQFHNDPVFKLTSSNGVFLCRNHDWFTSSVRTWPGESQTKQVHEQTATNLDALKPHVPFLRLKKDVFPRLEVLMLKRIVAFFRHWSDARSAEAIVKLMVSHEGSMEIVVPDQFSYVSVGDPEGPLPLRVEYEDIAHHSGLFWADCHSHAQLESYTSVVDHLDDAAGVHIIIGRLDRPQPDICASMMVDGHRFQLVPEHWCKIDDLSQFQFATEEGDFPEEWLKKVHVREVCVPRPEFATWS